MSATDPVIILANAEKRAANWRMVACLVCVVALVPLSVLGYPLWVLWTCLGGHIYWRISSDGHMARAGRIYRGATDQATRQLISALFAENARLRKMLREE